MALKTKELVNYQTNSIVSSVLLDEDSGSLTIFAFDQGQKLSEHTAPYDAFIHVIEGQAEITIQGERNVLGEGDSIILPANKPHAVNAPKRFKMLLL
ncbi:MAG: cupin domain-containing protein [Candidatus Methanosuratincola sp.]|jgi:quercetin dioxygenase-like cupin family protein|nr:cupin domain-containing protein [Candidatus Methanosuratincola sp.]